MAVAGYDRKTAFQNETLARLGPRDPKKMTSEQSASFQKSAFMQGARKVDDVAMDFLHSRDEKRKRSDPSFEAKNEDFKAPKTYPFDKSVDYYTVLGIDEYATQQEVKKTYRKLSLVYHPDKAAGLDQEQKEEHAEIFIQLKNAYLTLSDNPTRRQYDFARDHNRAQYESKGKTPPKKEQFNATEFLNRLQAMQKPPGANVDIPVLCKLEKFVYGGHKAVKRPRNGTGSMFSGGGHRVFRIDVPGGAAEPHEVSFKEAGDHHEHTRPDSLTFKVASKPHAQVERKKDDLFLKQAVRLGSEARGEPYLAAQTASVRGREVLVWGRSPFSREAGLGPAELRVRIHGEGVTAAGSLHFACRVGHSEGGPHRAASENNGTLITLDHIETGATMFMLVSERAVMSDIRQKAIEILGLGAGAQMKLLTMGKRGARTYHADIQALGALRSLSCDGTSWRDVPLPPEKAERFLKTVLNACTSDAFRAEVASKSSEVLWRDVLRILPEYGFEPKLRVLRKRVVHALEQVAHLPSASYLRSSLAALPALEISSTLQASGLEMDRPDLEAFLIKFQLGPLGISEAVKPAERNDLTDAGITAARNEGGKSVAPAMLRRVDRRMRREVVCEAELMPVRPAIGLPTTPACTVAFYADKSQQMFAISIASPVCAKRAASSRWESLRNRLLPVLHLTAFHLIPAVRSIIPKAIASFPAFADDGNVTEQGMPCSGERPMPWKLLGDEAFRRGDYYTSLSAYTKCLDELSMGDEITATIYSNRAASFAKLNEYAESRRDAKQATDLRPTWDRAWIRAGVAASGLGPDFQQEAIDSNFKAVALAPTAANVSALQAAAQRAKDRNPDVAHEEKEKGNEALRVGELGPAVAFYTAGLAFLPSDEVRPGALEKIALLRCVLHSNRSAAFCRLRNWSSAVADAEQAVEAKGDFEAAQRRLGTALLGAGFTELAYAEFAKALKLDGRNQTALRGREACIATLPLWKSLPARSRFKERFGMDFRRPKGSTKVYAISDVHFDHTENENWAHSVDDFKYQEDVLIVAGNAADTLNATVRALTTLKAKFRRVFYVPGNHEMRLRSEASRFPDSMAKFLALLAACDKLGVDVTPAAVCKDLFVVPLFSWYTAEFNEADPFPDTDQVANASCRWPLDPEAQMWKYMLRLNEAHLSHLYHGTIITFSHFLPRRDLPFDHSGSAGKTIGCEGIDDQLRKVGSRVHFYGHSGYPCLENYAGVIYTNHYHGFEGWKHKQSPFLCIYDGKKPIAPKSGVNGSNGDSVSDAMQIAIEMGDVKMQELLKSYAD